MEIGQYGPTQFSSHFGALLSTAFEASRPGPKNSHDECISIAQELEMSEKNRQTKNSETGIEEAKAKTEIADANQSAAANKAIEAPSARTALPLKHVLRQIFDKISAKIIDVRTSSTQSGTAYRVKIRTTDGEIKSVLVDEKTGKIIEIVGF